MRLQMSKGSLTSKAPGSPVSASLQHLGSKDLRWQKDRPVLHHLPIHS